MADNNLTIIEEITPVEDIVDEDIPAEDLTEDDLLIIEMGGVEINSLDFVPKSGKLIYNENQATFNGEFRYTTVRKPEEVITATGSITFGIKGEDGVVVDADEDGTSVVVHIDGEILEKINSIENVKLDITTINGLIEDLQRETLKIDGILAETNYEMKQNTADIQELQMGAKDLNDYIEDLQIRVKDIEDAESTTLTTNTPQIIKKEGAKIFEGGFGISSENGADVVQINNYGTAISLLGPDGNNILYLDRTKQVASAFGKQLATLDDVIAAGGTKVMVDGKVQETFNADTKADKTEIQNFVEMRKTEGNDTAMITNYGKTVSMGVQNQDSGSILGLSSNSLQLSISEGDKESSIQMLPNHVDVDTEDFTWNGYTIATKIVDDLENYYTKTDSYNKTEVNQLINNISSLKIEIVTSLPTEDISTSTIYLIAKPAQTEDNIYDEYIYVSGKWELIGSTAIDLTGYYTKEEIDNINSDLSSQIEQISIDVGSHEDRIDKNTDSIASIKLDIKDITPRVETVETSVDKLNETTLTLKDNMDGGFQMVDENISSLQNSKQDKLEAGDNISIQNNIINAHIVIDKELSKTSGNPVQNNVITNALEDIKDYTNEKVKDYLPLTGGIVTGNIISTADITSQTATFGAAKLMGSVTSQEEDYVVVADTAGNMHKRAMNKVLDDIGGSTILNNGIRQSTFDVKTLQEQITENADDIATNIADIASLQTSKQNKLTAGENITIDENNVISANGGGTSDELNKVINNETIIGPISENKALLIGKGAAIYGSENSQTILGNLAQANVNSVAIGNAASAIGGTSVAVGEQSKAEKSLSVAIGYSSSATGRRNIAIGHNAKATAGDTDTGYTNHNAIQIGAGTNNTDNTLKIFGDNIYNHSTHTLTVNNIELNGNDLAKSLAEKQNTLTAGDNITIVDNVISSTGGGSTDLNNLINNTTLISNSSGGFAAGDGANATSTGIAIGKNTVSASSGVSIGVLSNASGNGTAIGARAIAQATSCIQLGQGTNSTTRTLQVYNDNIYNANTHALKVDRIDNANGDNTWLNLAGDDIYIGNEMNTAGNAYLYKNTEVWGTFKINGIHIVESGDNWIRFSDGTQICYDKFSTSEGAITRSFPKPFNTIPIVMRTNMGSSNGSVVIRDLSVYNVTTTSYIAYLYTQDSPVQTLSIGKWR